MKNMTTNFYQMHNDTAIWESCYNCTQQTDFMPTDIGGVQPISRGITNKEIFAILDDI